MLKKLPLGIDATIHVLNILVAGSDRVIVKHSNGAVLLDSIVETELMRHTAKIDEESFRLEPIAGAEIVINIATLSAINIETTDAGFTTTTVTAY